MKLKMQPTIHFQRRAGYINFNIQFFYSLVKYPVCKKKFVDVFLLLPFSVKRGFDEKNVKMYLQVKSI
jgi:hypothetical protein